MLALDDGSFATSGEQLLSFPLVGYRIMDTDAAVEFMGKIDRVNAKRIEDSKAVLIVSNDGEYAWVERVTKYIFDSSLPPGERSTFMEFEAGRMYASSPDGASWKSICRIDVVGTLEDIGYRLIDSVIVDEWWRL